MDANPTQVQQTTAAVSDWKAVILLQGTTSGQNIPSQDD